MVGRSRGRTILRSGRRPGCCEAGGGGRTGCCLLLLILPSFTQTQHTKPQCCFRRQALVCSYICTHSVCLLFRRRYRSHAMSLCSFDLTSGDRAMTPNTRFPNSKRFQTQSLLLAILYISSPTVHCPFNRFPNYEPKQICVSHLCGVTTARPPLDLAPKKQSRYP